jgi:hypothetical protein
LQAHGFRYSFTPLPGYFSSFPHGTDPLSVTRKYLGLPGGPGRFTANSTGSLLLGKPLRHHNAVFAYGTLTHSGPPFQTVPLTTRGIPSSVSYWTVAPTTPHTQRLTALPCARFSLFRFRSPLLTESRLFSLPTGTEMFHFPAFPPHRLYIHRRVTPHHGCRVTPFGHPRITARLAAPRGLSQPPTSFIGPWCQDIHRVPYTT